MRFISADEDRSAFTLIELLVVIAIIAILAVVVVLTLNPAQLLAQSRDSNRLSDLSTMADAINVYNTDQSGALSYSLGTASTTYISVADSSATSTTGTNCSAMGLPATSTGWTDHCAASNTLRLANGQGWIPINFSNISSGVPLSVIPIDPTNTTSSFYYYTYLTNGSTYELTIPLESQKYLKQELIIPDADPTRYTAGNTLSLLPQAEGLVGYWSLDEGVGTTTFDQSGNGNNGTWSGTATGTNGYYSPGKVGQWAGTFDGSTDILSVATTSLEPVNVSVALWLLEPSNLAAHGAFSKGYGIFLDTAGRVDWYIYNGSSNSEVGTAMYALAPGTWYFLVGTYDGSTMRFYINGQQIGSATSISLVYGSPFAIFPTGTTGGSEYSIDDYRVYNRALSAVEVQTLYNAEK
jgi:prepilin-type N-terminal cleavage/methylation domain-containing protein